MSTKFLAHAGLFVALTRKLPVAFARSRCHRLAQAMICGRGEKTYIWQDEDWPNWRYDLSVLAAPLAETSRAQGLLLGRLADVDMALCDQASLAALAADVQKTSEIEGERLNVESVRSSLARRLGVDIGALPPTDRYVEGVVEMALDATSRSATSLTVERLFGWHAALFPTGYSGMSKITVGQWRNAAAGPMQVFSGPIHRRKVHFQAQPATALPAELARFLAWVNVKTSEAALIKAGLAHLWFVTLHPFEDGNGRIARAVSSAHTTLDTARFWHRWAGASLNAERAASKTPQLPA
jgi:Fic family protein